MVFLKNRTVIGVICILLSLLICFGLTPLFNKGMSQKTEIVRVTKEIKAGDYMIGTMLEVPRAAVTADEIAREADFFSFGTNDLTQMGFGFSRDDSGKFLDEYVNKGILNESPFESIDQKGVGKLMKIAVELGQKTRPDIKLGICGEHGG